ncbi:hypothetical protein H2508_04565 [Parahaliea sp. F7430]|uniref:Uncharacterized protein n=1 Tax=Sediminihaliea albiluteola TaxID=2758564 RepID=A0A7W2TUY7_9GAMM|nr:hypothetical protein [Sediminihaliea albiluteola]MBA6412379.1 hypothetical protein [Sediminihaliea albiluteola]
MAKANSKGMLPNGRKKSGPQFTRALHAITDHPDYIAMSKQSRAFLWDLSRQYNGFNNGNLAACLGVMGKLGWTKWELMRARKEAESLGWIEVTRYPSAKRDPVLYRLTWLKTDKWDGKPKLDVGAHAQRVRSLK